MPVQIKLKEKTMLVLLKGEIDHHSAPDMREAIDDAIITNDAAKHIILDFSAVSFMDSSGVGLVMGRYRFITPMNIKLRVDNLSNRDYKIMRMSGIEKLAQINKKTESESK